ncbi:MAG: universal stress protein [Acidimicrobiales bacterium]|nr:universal stress protein [Acidimicrobiales bacterium]
MYEPILGAELRTIVAGCDGSAPSQRAVAWAARLARALDAQLVLVHALALLEHLPGGQTVVGEQVRTKVEQLVRTDWSDAARAVGVEPDCVVEDGPPVLVLPRVAGRCGAELIVVGARGRGGAPDLLLGSTSHGVAQTSPVPVVIVPDRPTPEA